MTDNFSNYANTPTLQQLLDLKQFETMAKINCMRIGIIQSVNGLIAECLITNKKTLGTNANGLPEVKEYPPITARIYYMGNSENNINYPLLQNQPCLLLFNDREFTSYFETGEVSTCATDELHSLNYAICIPLAQPTQDGNFNIITNGNLNITAKNITLKAEKININGQLIINNVNYLDHTHSKGDGGNPTGGVIV